MWSNQENMLKIHGVQKQQPSISNRNESNVEPLGEAHGFLVQTGRRRIIKKQKPKPKQDKREYTPSKIIQAEQTKLLFFLLKLWLVVPQNKLLSYKERLRCEQNAIMFNIPKVMAQ